MFCIDEQHRQQLPKFRAIDDLPCSHVNSTADMSGAYCPGNLDALATQAIAFANLGRTDLDARSVGSQMPTRELGYAENPRTPPLFLS